MSQPQENKLSSVMSIRKRLVNESQGNGIYNALKSSGQEQLPPIDIKANNGMQNEATQEFFDSSPKNQRKLISETENFLGSENDVKKSSCLYVIINLYWVY